MRPKFLFFLFLASAVPFSDDLATSGFPAAICVAVRERICPPYLFVAVNLIILTVWKLSAEKNRLSDNKSHPPPSPGRHSGSSNRSPAVSDATPRSSAMDAMERSGLAIAGAGVTPEQGRRDAAAEEAREVNRKASEAVDNDELDRRFEEFIRKVNDQIRREPCDGYVAC